MSWGIKITVLYLGFVAIILSLVFTCFGHKTELEYSDYYARELKFQDQIDATANATNLETPIDYLVQEKSLQLTLPKALLSEDITGNIQFLRPSDASQDKIIALAPDPQGTQLIDPGFIKGVYKMQISINSRGKSYYKEAIVNFK
jgi:hypothetical protein